MYFVQNKLWRIYSFKLVASLNHKTLHVQSEREGAAKDSNAFSSFVVLAVKPSPSVNRTRLYIFLTSLLLFHLPVYQRDARILADWGRRLEPREKEDIVMRKSWPGPLS
jgi:hypothetical protein